ncbi:formyltransferase family protein [Pseudomonadota bacterium]|nr:formyltransferase family protein [Pseudomonadota bacterium]
MKIACVGYRDWALKIYESIDSDKHEILLQSSEEKYNEDSIRAFNPDLVLFYGWSKIIDDSILNDFICLMLHPSALPKFRGGSPLQNQIINGVKDSKITIFRMNQELDAGDIVAQCDLNLRGSIDEIFYRLEDLGAKLTNDFLENGISYKKQDHTKATYFKRRKPEESELTIDEISNQTSEYLFNKIRMLGDPYPNAFIKTKDGKKILIKLAEIEGN